MQLRTRRLFEFTPTRSGTSTRYRTTIRCSKCPNERDYSTGRPVPDEAVFAQFKRWGWLMSKSGSHNVCPDCLGASGANKLAEIFKVRQDGRDVPPMTEVVEQAHKDREAELSDFQARIARHLPSRKPAEPEPSPKAETDNGLRAAGLDCIPEVWRREMDQTHAAHELIIEQNQKIIEQNSQTLDYARQIAEHSAQQTKHQAQLIEAIARLSGMIGRHEESMIANLNSAAAALTTIAASVSQVGSPAPKPPEPEPIPELPAEPASALPPLDQLPRPSRGRPLHPGYLEHMRALAADGHHANEVARRLDLSTSTVHRYWPTVTGERAVA